jgi:hypothetical protein
MPSNFRFFWHALISSANFYTAFIITRRIFCKYLCFIALQELKFLDMRSVHVYKGAARSLQASSSFLIAHYPKQKRHKWEPAMPDKHFIDTLIWKYI